MNEKKKNKSVNKNWSVGINETSAKTNQRGK